MLAPVTNPPPATAEAGSDFTTLLIAARHQALATLCALMGEHDLSPAVARERRLAAAAILRIPLPAEAPLPVVAPAREPSTTSAAPAQPTPPPVSPAPCAPKPQGANPVPLETRVASLEALRIAARRAVHQLAASETPPDSS